MSGGQLRPLAFNPWAFRPARKQRKAIATDARNLQAAEVTSDYNIWYHRQSGGDRHTRRELVKAVTRCNVDADAGRTLGDDNENAFLCLYFARGCCERGADCTYIHRPPNEFDELRVGMLRDVFGRERHAADRDDMTGVGSFNRDCRTLHVSRFEVSADTTAEELLRRQFGEFGEIENVKVLPGRPVAFIDFKLRVCAEFAKEAMYCQSLGGEEVIDVRWSREMPNPRANERRERDEKRRAEERRVLEAIMAAAPQSVIAQQAQATLLEQSAKRAHDDTAAGGSGSGVVGAYPDTSAQYAESAASAYEAPSAKRAAAGVVVAVDARDGGTASDAGASAAESAAGGDASYEDAYAAWQAWQAYYASAGAAATAAAAAGAATATAASAAGSFGATEEAGAAAAPAGVTTSVTVPSAPQAAAAASGDAAAARAVDPSALTAFYQRNAAYWAYLTGQTPEDVQRVGMQTAEQRQMLAYAQQQQQYAAALAAAAASGGAPAAATSPAAPSTVDQAALAQVLAAQSAALSGLI